MRLHSIRVGDGQPDFAFLHGLFGQGRNWTSIAKALEPANSLLIDLPNHGQSERTDRVDLDSDAEAVAEHLQAHEVSASRPVTLVGHSLGGKVAMRLTLGRPELICRLVVVDISPVAGIAEGEFRGYIEGLRGLDLERLNNRAEADAEVARAIPDERVRSFLLSNLRRTAEGWSWLINLELIDAELSELGGWPPVAADPFAGPVLWIAGDRSPYVKPEHAAAMRELFPKARLVRLKDAGHWVHSDQPEALVSILRAFQSAAVP